MEQKQLQTEHCLILEHRRSLKITGVTDVVAYDENIVQLKTVDQDLEIRGEGLHMRQLVLEQGIIEVDGTIQSMEYQNSKGLGQGESFWKRLLR